MSLIEWRSCIVWRATRVALLLVGCCMPTFAQAPAPAVTPIGAPSLAAAKSWGYQLQRVKPEVLAAIPYDVFVIDYSRDGTDERRSPPRRSQG